MLERAGHRHDATSERFVMPPVPSPFILTLPLPPSVNRLTPKLGSTSSVVKKWLAEVDPLILSLKPLPPTIKGPYSLRVVFSVKQFGRFDIDNRIKVLMDYLERIEIVINDKFCIKLVVEFGFVPRGFCRVEVSAIP